LPKYAEQRRIRTLALWAALLPLATFNVCYVIAASLEHVPQCIPYLDGCTSASSSGRASPERWIFKLGMLPAVPVVLLLWWRIAAFLEAGGGSAALRLFGIVAALSLLLYIVTLGVPGDDYRGLRRIGINGFALGIFVAQVVFVVRYRSLSTDATRALLIWLSALCIFVPLTSLAGEGLKALGAPRHPVNNIVAWNALWLQSLWFVLLARLVQRHGGGE